MSLIRKHEMTEKQLAANHRSQKLARGLSPSDRAAEIAPTHPNARLMRRMQDSNFREVRRLTNLLLKTKRYESQTGAIGKTAALHDVKETKGVSNLR